MTGVILEVTFADGETATSTASFAWRIAGKKYKKHELKNAVGIKTDAVGIKEKK